MYKIHETYGIYEIYEIHTFDEVNKNKITLYDSGDEICVNWQGTFPLLIWSWAGCKKTCLYFIKALISGTFKENDLYFKFFHSLWAVRISLVTYTLHS